MTAARALVERRTAAAIDFLIITILDLEFEAVRKHVPGLAPERHRDDPLIYYRGTLPILDGSRDEYSIAAIQLNGMGNLSAAVACTLALQRFQPQAIVVVGIAGGVPGELNLGDVAISRDLVYYEVGKEHEKHFEYRASPVRAQPILAGHAKEVADHDWHNNISLPAPNAPEVHLPIVKIGTIGSGEKVLDSDPFIKRLKTQYKHLIAVAMEGSGAAAPAQYLGKRAGDVLEIRGISDLANGTKADSWQSYAADVAASFMAVLLASGPITPIEGKTHNTSDPRPFTAIRIQSFGPVNPDGVVAPLKSFGATSVNDANVDLADYTSASGRVKDAGAAVSALLDESGSYLRALAAGGKTQLCVYGQMHIPFAALAGALATDRLSVRLLDFHRDADPPGWSWGSPKPDGGPAISLERHLDAEAPADDAIIRVSVSYPVEPIATSTVIARARYAYDLSVQSPVIDIVDSESQARGYAKEVRTALDLLAGSKPRPKRIHIFYAGPISVAFAIGQAVSLSIHPAVILWNYRAGTYDWGIDLGRALDGLPPVVHPIDFAAEG